MATKFKVTKEKILEGLQRVQNIVSARTTLPILSNVLLQAGKDGLSLTTTDLDVSVRCVVAAEVSKPGATTLPARKLFTILKEVPAEEIEVEVDERNGASFRCGSSFYKIMGLPEEEFPRFPQVDGPKPHKLEQQVLRELLRETSYAVSNDETRYVLNGVYMSFKGDKLTVVATDGRRLALAERELEVAKGSEAEFILPTKVVVELQHLLGEKGDVNLSVGDDLITFNLPETILASKLVEGTYPNFRQVIPAEAKERVPMEREMLLAALHRASILASDKTQSVKLGFGKNTLTITASTPEVGEAKETLAINYKGKELTIAFNPQYLMDPLRNLDADEVFFELTDELSPGVLKINAPFLYVLMPMRLNSRLPSVGGRGPHRDNDSGQSTGVVPLAALWKSVKHRRAARSHQQVWHPCVCPYHERGRSRCGGLCGARPPERRGRRADAVTNICGRSWSDWCGPIGRGAPARKTWFRRCS